MEGVGAAVGDEVGEDSRSRVMFIVNCNCAGGAVLETKSHASR